MSSNGPVAFLISNLERSTAQHLHSQLERQFTYRLVAPVFPEPSVLKASDTVDTEAFRARHLRSPLIGEVGCALAHRNVYSEVLASECPWALVLEDDVVINDEEKFGERVRNLARRLPQSIPVIVNLNAEAASRHRLSRHYEIEGLWRPSVSTYTTSCYLINQEAARIVMMKQIPIASQADWPISSGDVLFLQESYDLAAPSKAEPSTVDPSRARAEVMMKTRLEIWTGVWFARHHRHFAGPIDYWRSVLKRRIYRHIY